MYNQSDIALLVNIIKNHVKENLDSIILFGSYARHNASSSSDIDIAILLKSIIERREKLKLLNSLWWDASKKGLSVDFVIKTVSDYNIDITLPTLSRTINNEGRIIWQNQ